MFTAEHFRAKAAESAESAKNTEVPSDIRKFQETADSFSALAKNEDWLADNFEKMINSEGLPYDGAIAGKRFGDEEEVAEVDEHILRCLGAAVMMQWHTIPTKLQRELFDTAGSLGDVPKTTALRGQIARFLHNNKDEELRYLFFNPDMTRGKV
jgi:hypothetical protein